MARVKRRVKVGLGTLPPEPTAKQKAMAGPETGAQTFHRKTGRFPLCTSCFSEPGVILDKNGNSRGPRCWRP